MSRYWFATFLVVWATSAVTTVAAQNAPRLFTTPELRAELERRRLGFVAPERPSAQTETEILQGLAGDESKPEEIIYSLEGVMLRDNGASIVWLNGQALGESDLPDNIELLGSDTKGRLKIMSPENEEFQIFPGQVLNLSSGTLYESYQWQEILSQRLSLEIEAVESAAELVESIIIEE